MTERWIGLSLFALACRGGAGEPSGLTDSGEPADPCPAPPPAVETEPVDFNGAAAPYEKLTGLHFVETEEGLAGFLKARGSDEEDAQILRFDSTDGGATWTERPGCAVSPGALGALDALALGTPSVRRDGDGWTMWYRADDAQEVQRILRATSADGCAWAVDPTPALEPGEDWASIAVIGPHVLDAPDGDGLWLYYRGSAFENQMASDIGLARSADGAIFTPWPDNPVFPRAEEGWDSSLVADPQVWAWQGRLLMLYAGHDEPNTPEMSRDEVGLGKQVGLAASWDGLDWRRCGDGPALASGLKADNAFTWPEGDDTWVYLRVTEEEDGSGGVMERARWPGWP